MDIIKTKNGIEAVSFGDINLPLTLDCGQCFRWENCPDGSFFGTAYNKSVKVRRTENGLLFENTNMHDVENIWVKYFDLEYDYENTLKRLSQDSIIKEEYAKYGTIRILNQEPFETLCSFIISACNNIPRIKGIVKRLCEAYGDKEGEAYTFPSAETLAMKTPEDLDFLRAGYRVPYILDAARKTAEGEIDFEYIKTLEIEKARYELMKIKGVGKKVADCTLLFSLGFRDCFPVDRHIARAVSEYYPDGLPKYFSSDMGLSQQYIFNKCINIQ